MTEQLEKILEELSLMITKHLSKHPSQFDLAVDAYKLLQDFQGNFLNIIEEMEDPVV